MSRLHSDAWRRRHALALAAQLPEQHEDAKAVIRLMQDLIDGFLNEQQAPRPVQEVQRGRLLALPLDCDNSPSRLAKSNGKPSLRPL